MEETHLSINEDASLVSEKTVKHTNCSRDYENNQNPQQLRLLLEVIWRNEDWSKSNFNINKNVK